MSCVGGSLQVTRCRAVECRGRGELQQAHQRRPAWAGRKLALLARGDWAQHILKMTCGQAAPWHEVLLDCLALSQVVLAKVLPVMKVLQSA
jgi:hypothetical protein